MASNRPKLVILVAEDDEDAAHLLKRAFKANGIDLPAHICTDGEDTMNYLRGLGRYSDRNTFPFPRVLVTDLKMPRCSGFDILQWLQSHPECNLIPKIVFSGSNQEADVIKAYQLGANCYFTKPSTNSELNNIVKLMHQFWSTADLPPLPANC